MLLSEAALCFCAGLAIAGACEWRVRRAERAQNGARRPEAGTEATRTAPAPAQRFTPSAQGKRQEPAWWQMTLEGPIKASAMADVQPLVTEDDLAAMRRGDRIAKFARKRGDMHV